MELSKKKMRKLAAIFAATVALTSFNGVFVKAGNDSTAQHSTKPNLAKTATLIEGTDDYAVELRVTGKADEVVDRLFTATEKDTTENMRVGTKTDVIFVVDVSGSMDEHGRWQATKNALGTGEDGLVYSVLKNNYNNPGATEIQKKNNNTVSLVAFAGSKDKANKDYAIVGGKAYTDYAEVQTKYSVVSTVEEFRGQYVKVVGGSNSAAGFQGATQQIKRLKALNNDPERKYVVIYITDGSPTYGISYNGRGLPDGEKVGDGSKVHFTAIEYAAAEARKTVAEGAVVHTIDLSENDEASRYLLSEDDYYEIKETVTEKIKKPSGSIEGSYNDNNVKYLGKSFECYKTENKHFLWDKDELKYYKSINGEELRIYWDYINIWFGKDYYEIDKAEYIHTVVKASYNKSFAHKNHKIDNLGNLNHELENIFKEIEITISTGAEIKGIEETRHSLSEMKVTDKLNSHLDFDTTLSRHPLKLNGTELSVLNANPSDNIFRYGLNGDTVAEYNANTGTFTWGVNSLNEQRLEYIVTVKSKLNKDYAESADAIIPIGERTDEAVYAASGLLVADENTGTHAGKPSYFVSHEAMLDYKLTTSVSYLDENRNLFAVTYKDKLDNDKFTHIKFDDDGSAVTIKDTTEVSSDLNVKFPNAGVRPMIKTYSLEVRDDTDGEAVRAGYPRTDVKIGDSYSVSPADIEGWEYSSTKRIVNGNSEEYGGVMPIDDIIKGDTEIIFRYTKKSYNVEIYDEFLESGLNPVKRTDVSDTLLWGESKDYNALINAQLDSKKGTEGYPEDVQLYIADGSNSLTASATSGKISEDGTVKIYFKYRKDFVNVRTVDNINGVEGAVRDVKNVRRGDSAVSEPISAAVMPRDRWQITPDEVQKIENAYNDHTFEFRYLSKIKVAIVHHFMNGENEVDTIELPLDSKLFGNPLSYGLKESSVMADFEFKKVTVRTAEETIGVEKTLEDNFLKLTAGSSDLFIDFYYEQIDYVAPTHIVRHIYEDVTEEDSWDYGIGDEASYVPVNNGDAYQYNARPDGYYKGYKLKEGQAGSFTGIVNGDATFEFVYVKDYVDVTTRDTFVDKDGNTIEGVGGLRGTYKAIKDRPFEQKALSASVVDRDIWSVNRENYKVESVTDGFEFEFIYTKKTKPVKVIHKYGDESSVEDALFYIEADAADPDVVSDANNHEDGKTVLIKENSVYKYDSKDVESGKTGVTITLNYVKKAVVVKVYDHYGLPADFSAAESSIRDKFPTTVAIDASVSYLPVARAGYVFDPVNSKAFYNDNALDVNFVDSNGVIPSFNNDGDILRVHFVYNRIISTEPIIPPVVDPTPTPVTPPTGTPDVTTTPDTPVVPATPDTDSTSTVDITDDETPEGTATEGSEEDDAAEDGIVIDDDTTPQGEAADVSEEGVEIDEDATPQGPVLARTGGQFVMFFPAVALFSALALGFAALKIFENKKRKNN